MMGHRERLKGGAEWDLLYGRKYYCYLNRSRVCHNLKKGINRRIRRQLRMKLRQLKRKEER